LPFGLFTHYKLFVTLHDDDNRHGGEGGELQAREAVLPQQAGMPLPDTTKHVPSSKFDKVTYHMQMAIIYVFFSSGPSTTDVECGLVSALGTYRLFAGQVRPGPNNSAGRAAEQNWHAARGGTRGRTVQKRRVDQAIARRVVAAPGPGRRRGGDPHY
jgi:hypothetical protein